MDETCRFDSTVGQRLEKIKRVEEMSLSFQGEYFPIVSQITIGRDKKNKIVLDDSLVSRDHALIQKIKDAYFIKDLNSTNGTLVNNIKVPQDKYIKLYRNDVVKIGRTELIIK
jgi:pSer/pThr/pTyr-binding forkhead associated (FHA) protein